MHYICSHAYNVPNTGWLGPFAIKSLPAEQLLFDQHSRAFVTLTETFNVNLDPDYLHVHTLAVMCHSLLQGYFCVGTSLQSIELGIFGQGIEAFKESFLFSCVIFITALSTVALCV